MPDTRDCVTSYLEGLSNGDLADVPFDSDVVFESPSLDEPLRGREVLVEALGEVSATMEDLQVDRIVVEGDLASAIFTFSAGGQPIEVCDCFRVSNGAIVEIKAFYDPRPLA